MQIHAQSSHSVKQLPYYHLAYLAANNYTHQVFSGGALLVLFFIIFVILKRVFYFMTAGWSQRALRLLSIAAWSFFLLISAAIVIAGFKPAKQYLPSFSINEITNALHVYAKEHAGYLPRSSNWCDELATPNSHLFLPFEDSDLQEGQSGFALNVNAAGKKLASLPPNCVLIFETTSDKRGKRWNQCGGLELLTTQYNDGKGCDVSYADGRTEFIPKEKLHLLNWGPKK